MLPPHMWFPNLRSSSLHLLQLLGNKVLIMCCVVGRCLGVSAWQHILSFALHNSCMFELRRRTGHVYSLRGCIEKKTLKKAIHLYSCIRRYNNDPLCGSTKGITQICDIHMMINLLRQTDITCILWIYAVIKRVTWYFVVVHIASFMAPAGKKQTLQLTTDLYISIMVISMFFVLNFRVELIICRLNHTLARLVFKF